MSHPPLRADQKPTNEEGALPDDSWLRALNDGDEVFWEDPTGAKSGLWTIASLPNGKLTSGYSVVNLQNLNGEQVEVFAYELAAKNLERCDAQPVPAPAISTVQFIATFNVADSGEFEPSTIRDALIDGVRRAEDEGNLTSLGDETTRIELASVRQVIGEAALLQFVKQIARLTLDTESKASDGLADSHEALQNLIQHARRLTASAPEKAGRPSNRSVTVQITDGINSSQEWTTDPDMIEISVTAALLEKAAECVDFMRGSSVDELTISWAFNCEVYRVADDDDKPDSVITGDDGQKYAVAELEYTLEGCHATIYKDGDIKALMPFKYTADRLWCVVGNLDDLKLKFQDAPIPVQDEPTAPRRGPRL